MKSILTIFCVLLVFVSTGQSLQEIRSEFHSTVLKPDKSRSFHSYIQQVEKPNTTIKAYQAVSEALLAQVVWNPFTKLSQVVKYDKQMAEAVEEDPMNIEIRFLRLAIEYNLPSFLGMSTHIDDDLKMITSYIESARSMQIDPSYCKYIVYFLESTGLCTTDQLVAMRENLAP